MTSSCKKCGELKSKSNLVFIVNDLCVFEVFCLGCARLKFMDEKFGEDSFLTAEGKATILGYSIKELREMSHIHEISMVNWAMNDSVQKKKILESEPIKDFLKEIKKGKK